MTISHADFMNNLTLYPPTKPILVCEDPIWDNIEYECDLTRLLLTIEKSITYKTKTKDDIISTCINNPSYVSWHVHQLIETTIKIIL